MQEIKKTFFFVLGTTFFEHIIPKNVSNIIKILLDKLLNFFPQKYVYKLLYRELLCPMSEPWRDGHRIAKINFRFVFSLCGPGIFFFFKLLD